jgi:uncharacterized protein (DUF697 family)
MSVTTSTLDPTSLEDQLVAEKIVNKYVWWSLGAGLIPLPYLDVAAIAGVQVKMLADLAGHYEVDGFHKERVKIVIASLIGGVLPGQFAGGLAGSIIKMIPVVGQVVGGVAVPVFAGATTYAVGRVFMQHFIYGGTFLDFDPKKAQDRFKQYVEEGKKVAADMGDRIKHEAETVAPRKDRTVTVSPVAE